MKFNVGDTVYQATAGQEQCWITCPECLGSGRLRVILGDDSEVSIACECCSRGYEGSPGRLQTYRFEGNVIERTITGMEVRQSHPARYSFGCWSTEETDLFATRDEACRRALVLVIEHDAEETKRLKYKKKNHKTWAWNVHYYRSGIRKAKEEIARYEARLAVAPKNVKEADKLES
jgi:Arc/MetJ-type ribon-helix-helix transcriptional regulator